MRIAPANSCFGPTVRIHQTIEKWAQRIRRDAVTLWFALRRPESPPLAKALSGFASAYALSPLDAAPDFIAVLGYLDDTLLLAGFIWLAMRMLPRELVEASRVKADVWIAEHGPRHTTYAGAITGIAALLAAALVALWYWYQH